MPGASPILWNHDLLRDPHAVADKSQRVRSMFAAIARCYDVNNRVHSLWLDQVWRRRAVALADARPTDTIVDIACGTGDLALEFARQRGRRPGAAPILGIDFTYAMLPLAQDKARRSLAPRPKFLCADAMRLPLPDACAQVVSIAFGIRNVADPATAIREFARILRPGGRLVILEFSLPANRVLRALYNLYFRHILPHTASLLGRDRSGAYRYLPRSVDTFLGRDQLQSLLCGNGFTDVEQHPLTLGVCVCYLARRLGAA